MLKIHTSARANCNLFIFECSAIKISARRETQLTEPRNKIQSITIQNLICMHKQTNARK